MDYFGLNPDNILSYLLTLFRISVLLFVLPFFGGQSVPNTVKASLCLILSLALWPRLSFPGADFPLHPLSLAILLLSEILLGLILGLMVRFIFAAIQTGGQIIGFQMGFAMVNVVDPLTGTSEAATAHFLYMTSMLTFLSLNGHLMLLHALGSSFELIPPGGLFFSTGLVNQVMKVSGQMFILALKIAAPVIAALFLVDLALALVGRASPQMNVLMLGFPLKISVGFLFLGLLFTIMSDYMRDFISQMGPMFHHLLLSASKAG